jgi:hypothetical protein
MRCSADPAGVDVERLHGGRLAGTLHCRFPCTTVQSVLSALAGVPAFQLVVSVRATVTRRSCARRPDASARIAITPMRDCSGSRRPQRVASFSDGSSA